MFINFKSVHLKNFLSHSDTEISLSKKGYCFVSGRNNYKADKALSNGSGKSTFLNAIVWCLTGETISGLRADVQNIYNDENDTYVKLEADINGKFYEITRINLPKSDLKIIVDGEDKSGKGLRESEKILSELLPDLTKDLISNVIVLGQGLPNKFTSHTPSGRKELLEKLSKSDFMIEDIKNRISSREDFLNTEIRKLSDSLVEINTKIQLYKNQAESVCKDLEDFKVIDYDKEIKDIDVSITSIEESITSLNSKLLEKDSEKIEVENKIKQLNNSKQADLTEELSAYNEFFESLISNISEKKSLVTQTETRIKELEEIKDICPTCGQKIPGVIKPDTSKEKAQLSNLKEELSKLDFKLTEAKSKHSQYGIDINKKYDFDINRYNLILTSINTEIKELKDKKYQLDSDLYKLKSSKDTLLYKKENDEKFYDDLKKKVFDLDTCLLKSGIEKDEVEVQKLELDNRLACVKKINTFVKRDFRGYLLREVIEYLNAKIKQYSLKIFDHDNIEIKLEGNNLNIYFNNKLCESLSGGERQKIDVLTQFSIRDLLVNYMDFHSSILCLDEITDNLDEVGCSKIFNLISSELTDLDSIFIISHHEDELHIPVDSEIVVTKNENGISSVEEK